METVAPAPAPGEAVADIQACGICATDLHHREATSTTEMRTVHRPIDQRLRPAEVAGATPPRRARTDGAGTLDECLAVTDG